MKIADKLIAGLLFLGYTEKPSKSGKVRAFSKGETTYHIGRGGACRVGRTYTDSVALFPQDRKRLIRVGEATLNANENS